jgi:hypothetical protein
MVNVDNEPETEGNKGKDRKTANLDELKAKLPHPYITGQRLRKDAEEPDLANEPPADSQHPTD